MSYQISKVKELPKAYRIPNGLHVGKQIIVRGRVTPGTDVFAINLQQEEESTDGEIAFHFNPRPSSGVCVRNSCSGDWMEEETDQPHFPFDDGKSFTLRIEVAESEFRTYVNGKPYINFGHRLDFNNVRYLYLTEGVEYYDITFQERYILPYTTEIPQNMQMGKAVRVLGAAQDNDGFSINLACDCENNSIAFHFNPRPNEDVVVRNANLDGWGDEERDYDADFPFRPLQYFDSLFICTDDQYVVYINGKKFTTFDHRCATEDVSHLAIRGNMDIKAVEYYEPMDDDLVKEIPSGLEKGDVIIVRGFMKPGGDGFAVNFLNGTTPDSGIAFHFNPRVGEGQIVMNSNIDGDWGEEEREDIPKCFLDSEPFEIKIVVKKNKFKVYSNGKKCAKYHARGDVEDIKGLNIKGDAFVYQARVEKRLEKPALEKIPGGFREGGWVVIHGIPKKESGGFAVNLCCGDDEDCDIAFHFNPRLNEGCTVRNTLSGGDWQDEERDQPSFPFENKDTFEIAINAQADKFITHVNGEHYVDFNHRLPLDSICHLKLAGDANFFEPEFY